MASLCDTGLTAMAPLFCILWERMAGMMEEIHCRRFPTRISRINLPGQGVIGSGPERWLAPRMAALLRSLESKVQSLKSKG
jgi:hypothetical protein